MKIAIIGTGWAGLATAVALAQPGIELTLLEAAPACGGRARAINSTMGILDNGQHLLMGAYKHLFSLLNLLSIEPQHVLKQYPFTLTMHQQNNPPLSMQFKGHPTPYHDLRSLLTTQGLGMGDKLRLLHCFSYMARHHYVLRRDCSVASYLYDRHQSKRLLSRFWQPLCLAALTTPAEQASMQIFLTVLKKTFAQDTSHRDMYLPKGTLTDVLPKHAIRYLTKRGATLHNKRRVTALSLHPDHIAVHTKHHGTLSADHVIVATSPQSCHRLLQAHTCFAPLCKALAQLPKAPITSIYLEFTKPIQLAKPMLGLLGGQGQWVFDRAYCGQPNIAAIVISGHGAHDTMTKEQLGQCIEKELRVLFPHLPPRKNVCVIREKAGAFAVLAGQQAHRPTNQTAHPHLWLAGDYTATDLPACLEGAVQSGLACAKALQEHNLSLFPDLRPAT